MSNQKTVGVDIGNSAIKTAEFMDSEIGEIREWQTLDQVVTEYPDTYFVVSSVGISKHELSNKLKYHLMLTSDLHLPISLNYNTPETLGSDRIAAAVGAWELFPETNLLVIDAGTCITYDFVTSEGIYQGGMISPGLDMRLKAMHEFTEGLPLFDLKKDFQADNMVGKSTKECLWLGAKNGTFFEMEGISDFFNKKYDRLQVVMTGGLASDFESISKAPIFASSKIVLIGLHAIWKFNEAN